MTPTTYIYLISVDFAVGNGVEPSFLEDEILASSIVTALAAVDSVYTSGDEVHITFKDPLTTADKTTLDGIVAAHDGSQTFEDVPQAVTFNTEPIIQVKKSMPVGSSVKIHTHDFADPTTWYQNSVLVTDEVVLDSGDHTIYTVAHNRLINTNSNVLVSRDKKFAKSDGTFGNRWDWFPTLKVNDVVVTTGFTIDYTGGTITFDSANLATDVVKLTYYYATDSTFTLRPPEGQTFNLEEARVCLSNIDPLGNTLRFDVFAGHPLHLYTSGDEETPMNQFAMRYRSQRDFLVNSDILRQHTIQGFTKVVNEYVFNYTSIIQIKSDVHMELRLSLADDANPPIAEVAMATFSMEIV